MNSTIQSSKKRVKKALNENFECHHLALSRSNKFLRNHDSKRLPMFVLYVDLVGLTLNLAAKMQRYAKPNQIIIGKSVHTRLSSKTKELFKKKETDSASWIFHQLKIKTPYSIYYNI